MPTIVVQQVGGFASNVVQNLTINELGIIHEPMPCSSSTGHIPVPTK